MGAFRVIGVTEEMAKFQYRKDYLASKTDLGEQEGIEHYYKKMKAKPCSQNFDAPQFCYEFIALCKKYIKCKAMSVQCYKENGKISKKTKKPLKGWILYDGK